MRELRESKDETQTDTKKRERIQETSIRTDMARHERNRNIALVTSSMTERNDFWNIMTTQCGSVLISFIVILIRGAAATRLNAEKMPEFVSTCG